MLKLAQNGLLDTDIYQFSFVDFKKNEFISFS